MHIYLLTRHTPACLCLLATYLICCWECCCFLLKVSLCMITLKLSYAFSFQQIVDVNVNYNAREGRSTVEVRLFIHLFYAVGVSLFILDPMDFWFPCQLKVWICISQIIFPYVPGMLWSHSYFIHSNIILRLEHIPYWCFAHLLKHHFLEWVLYFWSCHILL